MLNNNFAIIVFIAIQFITFSCQKKEKEIIVNDQEIKKSGQKQIEYKIEFPDTVYLNKTYEGTVKYKSVLDTITTSFDDKKKERYVIFYMKIVDTPYSDFEDLKKDSKEYGADNNREIPIYDIEFTKTGTYYIDGIIHDFVVIDIDKKDEEGSNLVRLIEHEERVTHKVYVLRESDKVPN